MRLEPHIVSVFGGSAPKPDSPGYQEALELGRLLAEAGFTVATGGYSGTMEAVSRGAAEAGGHVIGVTTSLIDREFGIKHNSWVKEVVHFDTLRDRLLHLVTFSDGLIALKGSIGTLSEVALTWSLLQVRELPLRPFVLVGPSWRRIVETFAAESYLRDSDRQLVRLVETVPEAVAYLSQARDERQNSRRTEKWNG